MVSWETGTWRVPRTEQEGDELVDPATVEASLGWLRAAHDLARQRRVRLITFVAPVGSVDPRYAEFYKPWPRYYGAIVGADARHRRLTARLRESGMEFVDLRDDLMGKPGSYRLMDGHWTEAGHEIVADRVAKVLAPLIRQ